MRDGRGRGYLRRVIAASADCAYYTKLIPSCSTKMVSGLWGIITQKITYPQPHIYISRYEYYDSNDNEIDSVQFV